MPNALAYLMLALWPVIAGVMMRRLPLERAIIWVILGGYLILPPATSFDPPLIPDLDKRSIPNLAVLFFLLVMLKRKVPLIPSTPIAVVLVLGFILGVVPTILTNGDPIVFQLLGQAEPIVFFVAQLPGTGLRDLISVVIEQFIILIPFFVARVYLTSPAAMRDLVLALFIGGLAYGLPALFETRFSPQFNTWIYGFFQHDFRQMIRGNGFRSIMFLQHGLWVAFFFMTAALSAAVLLREAEAQMRNRFLVGMLFLIFCVIAAKSLGSLVYTLMFVPLVLFSTPKAQIRVAVALLVLAVAYPVLRQYDLIPLEGILNIATSISEDRAQSLGYRFENEELLLARAHEKPLFGWGGWGRNLVRDMTTGRIISIPDGEWIILFGTFGWLGYISEMGLLALPIAMLWWRSGEITKRPEARLVAALILMLGITLADMLVNAILTPYTWLIAGALLGYAESIRDAAQAMPRQAGGPRAVIGDVAEETAHVNVRRGRQDRV